MKKSKVFRTYKEYKSSNLYTKEQLEIIKYVFKLGLTPEQIRTLTRPEYSVKTMQMMAELYAGIDNTTTEQFFGLLSYILKKSIEREEVKIINTDYLYDYE